MKLIQMTVDNIIAHEIQTMMWYVGYLACGIATMAVSMYS